MKRKALFIGVNEYKDSEIRNLSCSLRDAMSMHDIFEELGYQTDLLENPSKGDVFQTVRKMTSDMVGGDQFLFYFAGHGFTDSGQHLLFCADDMHEHLRFHRAGIPFDLLELETRNGGYDRVFLLDACQSDFLTGTRGNDATTRDMVAIGNMVPSAEVAPGAFYVLRSCSKYEHALEIESRKHGLFTLAMISVLRQSKHEGLELRFDDTLRETVRESMWGIASSEGISAKQTPESDGRGGRQVLMGGFQRPAPRMQPAEQAFAYEAFSYVVCPLCGKHNDVKDTFRCPACGKDHLCLSHQSKDSYCCPSCAEKKSATGVAELKVKAEKALERLGANLAETEKRVRRPKRHALFVGVNGYVSFRHLRCAVRDATDLHEFFRFEAGYDRVELLLDPRGEEEVVSAVQKLTSDLGGGDVFLFFFAGHGFRVMGNDVLACAGDSYKDMIRGDHVLSLCKLKRHFLSGVFDCALFLDAGRSEMIAARDLSRRDLILSDGPQANAFAIVSSCDIGQAPVESLEMHHGLFAMALLDLLKEAGKAHARLDLSFAFIKRLKERMDEIAARFGLPTEQCPRMICSGTPIVLLDEAPSTAAVG